MLAPLTPSDAVRRGAAHLSGPGRAERRAERIALRAELTDSGPVMAAAAAFLGVRPRSVAETRRRLRRLGYPNSLVDVVVQRLVEMEYLDDVEFARQWIESRDRARPRGQAALRRELALKGVARDVIDEALAERASASGGAEPVDADAAVRLLERRRTTLERETDPRRRRQKAYTLLSRSGFAPDVCAQVSAVFVGQNAETD